MSKWSKVRIGDLFSLEKGILQSSKSTSGKYTFITAAEDWKTHNDYSHDCEALVYAVAASGSLGRAHYVNGKFIASDLCFIMKEKDKKKYPINFKFYQFVFEALRTNIVGMTKSGTSKESINQKNFSNYLLPYVDIDHQNFWEVKLTCVRGQLKDLETEFEIQSSHISLLRQSILQEAVEGKLTAEWRKAHPDLVSGENHAGCLLEKIKAEKEQLLKQGKIKKQKPLPPITDEEKPFNLPEGWMWCRLENLGFLMGGGTPSTNSTEYWNGDIPWVCPRDMKSDIIISSSDYITVRALKKSSVNMIPKGSVLFVVRGMILAHTFPVGINKMNVTINQDMKALVPYIRNTNTFIQKMLNGYSRIILGLTNTSTHGTKRLEYSQSYAKIVYPLPPLYEQKAIVDRVDRFMCMVKDLEMQVKERKEKAEQLMQAVLREAFEGENVKELSMNIK